MTVDDKGLVTSDHTLYKNANSIIDLPHSGSKSVATHNHNRLDSVESSEIYDGDRKFNLPLTPELRITAPRSFYFNRVLYFSLNFRVYSYDSAAVLTELTTTSEKVNAIGKYSDRSLLIMRSSKEPIVYNLDTHEEWELKGVTAASSVKTISEGIICLTTLNNGIFILNNKMPQKLRDLQGENIGLMTEFKNNIYITDVNNGDKVLKFDFDFSKDYKIVQSPFKSRAYWLKVFNDELYMSQDHLTKLSESTFKASDIPVNVGNDVIELANGQFLHGVSTGIAFSNLDNYWSTFKGAINIRVRSILRNTDSTLIFGGSNGIHTFYERTQELKEVKSGIDVTCLAEVNKKILIGTKTNGVSIQSYGKFMQLDFNRIGNLRITKLLVDEYVFIGTNKGVFIYSKDLSFICRLNKSTGLSSNIVNSLLKVGNHLLVSTDNGLNRFDLSYIYTNSLPRLWFANDSIKTNSKLLELVEGSGNMTQEIKRISWSGFDENKLSYSINGGQWKALDNNTFDFSNYKVGDYEIEFKAQNGFGNFSNSLLLRLEISPVFYKRTWFIVAMIALVMIVLFVFARWRITKIQKLADEKSASEKHISELKDQALRSKLNPHFVFNSLNSIQRLYLDNQPDLANDYLSDFSTLFRRILDLSEKQFITIEDEIETLELYLELEQLRTSKAFDFNIFVSDDVDMSETLIPSLLLQPIVENAIWHGVLPMNYKVGEGRIDIRFYCIKDMLLIEVTDNGLGYYKSIKKRSSIHEPKGIQMTQERMEDFGSVNVYEGKKIGTTVQLKFTKDATNYLD